MRYKACSLPHTQRGGIACYHEFRERVEKKTFLNLRVRSATHGPRTHRLIRECVHQLHLAE